MTNETLIKLDNAQISQLGKRVLRDVCFEITNGEFVYLIGRTGSGKSSLLKTLYADIPLGGGNAEIVGFDLSSMRKKDIPFLRRKIGIVFQDFQLLYDVSVEENLAFVLRATGWNDNDKIAARIAEVLNLVGLQDKIKEMPYRLSGGEQQRVAVARALLNDPMLILADEPTGNLDPETTNDIMRLLIKIKEKGKAVFMATHNYNIIHKYPSRIINCTDGIVICSTNSTN
ncbi:MAG: ATP-binding cassette domain-containing protein [Bacteroidales bacterium]|nr:ATP-binding cassette domain-containing protein [Bacteroidales bacterium]